MSERATKSRPASKKLPMVSSPTAKSTGCGCGDGNGSCDTHAPAAEGTAATANGVRSNGARSNGAPEKTADAAASVEAGAGCHGGAERLRAAAEAGESSKVLNELVEDYPLGPHEQPQGMCPAFGSLRVGLRMRRTATVLSGSACCVYGLTFTSHFYGARRTVGYVPFNSESLVTGALFEDIKQAMEDLADPADYDAIVMTNLCIPTASGIPLDLLPKEINGVRIVGIDVPGFGVPTHAEAKDVLTGAVLKYARQEAERGPVARPRDLVEDRPTVTLIGELFPADPMGIDALLKPLGATVGTVVPPREWRELYRALDADVVAAVHPFYVRAVRQFEAAGRTVIPSGPVGVDGTAAWLRSVGEVLGAPAQKVGAAVDRAVGATRGALSGQQIEGRIVVSGYEGSELLVARLLVEAGADVPYVGTALPRSRWSDPDREWLEAHGAHVQYRASLEQDLAASKDVNPDLVLGTTPTVQASKERGTPALYFTNLISARPIFGPAGAGGIAEVIGGAIAGRERLHRMRSFFAGVGTGHAVGYGHEGVPERKLTAKERNALARAGRASTGHKKKSGTPRLDRSTDQEPKAGGEEAETPTDEQAQVTAAKAKTDGPSSGSGGESTKTAGEEAA